MKNILIPVDGSEYSMKAIDMGIQMAKAFDAEVTILNVVPLELSPSVGRGNYMYVPILSDEIPEVNAEVLDGAKKKFKGTEIRVKTVCKHGVVADEIVDYAYENAVDLVIMGSHGLGALKNRIMTGSVTTKVLHHIDKPVLVIK